MIPASRRFCKRLGSSRGKANLERLWSPWRSEYIASGDANSEGCVFCVIKEASGRDETNLVLYRGSFSFIVLNIYPYITGHLLIVPLDHVGELESAPKETTDEMMDLTKRSQRVLRDTYKPSGFNIGMNLGRVAGAGIADHIHIHVLPRWTGDTNFMSTVGQTRVISEELTTTYRKLRDRF